MPKAYSKLERLSLPISYRSFSAVLCRAHPKGPMKLLSTPRALWMQELSLSLEDDKRATTNVQNGLVFLLFSFIFLRKGLILRESPGGEKVWISVKKCEQAPNFAL